MELPWATVYSGKPIAECRSGSVTHTHPLPMTPPSKSAFSITELGPYHAHLHGNGRYRKGRGQDHIPMDPPGIYTVLDKGNPVVMDSSTFGLPKNSRLGYRETINYATRISTDGIYLDELDATVWAQGHQDTSHGCLNLNADNAKWFYDFSVPGDVVEVHNSGGPALTLEQNGDWTLSWDQWRQGSALKPTQSR